ncbi:hypothetical protein B0J14DRAFT_707848 [Halenospora varia]|nr:hypothetical protein B0J14DRAFT_707848 [Halenospora varia]
MSKPKLVVGPDEYVGAESKTDYSDLDTDLTAKGDSHSLYIADSDLADSDGFGFGSGTTLISDHLAANHQDDGNDNGIADGAKLQLAANCLRSASPGHRSITHQASPLRMNTEIIQGSASYVDLDVTKEVEDEGADIFANGDDDDADTCSPKRSRSFTISCNNPASDSNVSISELQDGQHDSAQYPQPGLAVASLQQSDWTNDPLLRHRRQRDATRNVCRKQPRTPAPTGLASIVSAPLESNDLEDPQSVALVAALGQEREIPDIDQEIVDEGTDDSNDKDYGDSCPKKTNVYYN